MNEHRIEGFLSLGVLLLVPAAIGAAVAKHKAKGALLGVGAGVLTFGVLAATLGNR